MEFGNSGAGRQPTAGWPLFSGRLPAAPGSIMIGSRGGAILNLDVTRPETFLDPSEIMQASGPLNLAAPTDGVAAIYAYLAGVEIYPPWGSHGLYRHPPAEVPFGQAEGQSEIIHTLYKRPDDDIGKYFYQGCYVPGSISLLGIEGSSGEYLPIALALPVYDNPCVTHYLSFMTLYGDHPDYKKVQQAGIELGVHEFGGRDQIYTFFHLTGTWVNIPGCAPFKYLNSPGLYAPTTPVTWALLNKALEYANRSDVVLDVGTGSGIVAVGLAKSKECEVDGIDCNPRAVLAARSAALLARATERTRFWQSDVFDAVPGKYDIITCYPVVDDSIAHVLPGIRNDPNRFDATGNFDRKFYGELAQFLKPGPRSRAFIGACSEVGAKLPPELEIKNEHPARDKEKILEIGWRGL